MRTSFSKINGPIPRFGHERANVDVAPFKIRGEDNPTTVRLNLSGDAESHAADLCRVDVGLADDAFDGFLDALEDANGSVLAAGGVLGPRDQLQLIVEEARKDLGAAQIDTEPIVIAHAILRSDKAWVWLYNSF